MQRFLPTALGGFLLLMMALPAHAQLSGTTVTACWNTAYSGAVTADVAQCDNSTIGFSTTSATIGPGIEFSIAGDRTVDFSDDSVTINYNSFSVSASPDLFIFELQVPVTSVVLTTTNQLNVTTAASGNRLGLLINSPLANSSGTVTVSFQLNGGAPPVAVPALGIVPLIGLMLTLLGVGGLRLQRKRR